MVPIQNTRTNFNYKSLVCKTFYKKCKYNMLVALSYINFNDFKSSFKSLPKRIFDPILPLEFQKCVPFSWDCARCKFSRRAKPHPCKSINVTDMLFTIFANTIVQFILSLCALKQWISRSLKHDTVPRITCIVFMYRTPKRIALWEGESSLLLKC